MRAIDSVHNLPPVSDAARPGISRPRAGRDLDMRIVDASHPVRTMVIYATGTFLLAAVFGWMAMSDRGGMAALGWVVAVGLVGLGGIFTYVAVAYARGKVDPRALGEAVAERETRAALDPEFEHAPRRPSRRLQGWRNGVKLDDASRRS